MATLISNDGFPILSVLIFSPLAAAAVAASLRNERALRWFTLAFTTAAFGLSLTLWTRFDRATANFQLAEQAAWIPWLKVNYVVGVDGISLVLVLLTTLVTPACVLASWRYIRTRVREFMIALLVMQGAMTGVFCSLDFILFFVFWEAMLIPMALMIGVWGGPRRVYAAIKFFIYTMAGSVFLLVAIIALYLHAGTFSIPDLMGRPYAAGFQRWVFVAFFLSFAIKVPMFPFHTWLPAAHVEAPTAGSVLLASVLLKMGTYGFVRFSLPITPDAALAFAPYVLGLSVVAIVYGGFAALAQSDLKKLVAYSSVAHMGFVTLGTFCFTPAVLAADAGHVRMGLEGAVLQMLNHGVTTGALFICVGFLYERLHTRELDQSAGLGRFMPVFITCFGVFSLSSMAFPGTNSFVGEFLVLAGSFPALGYFLVAVVPGVVLAAAYMLRVLQRVAYGGVRNPDHSSVADLDLREIVTVAPLLVLVLWIGLKPGPLVEILQPSLLHIVEILKQAAGS